MFELPYTPKIISRDVLKFCETISNHKPIYIAVVSDSQSEVNECFPNVEEKVKVDGGKIKYGWQVWKTRNYLIEAEFHAVWESDNGECIDITPKENLEDKILFLTEDEIVYKGVQIDNIRESLVKDVLVDELIKNRREYFLLMNSENIKDKYGVLTEDDLTTEQVKRCEYLMKEHIILINKIEEKYSSKEIGVNDECLCGSGKKYKKCCKLINK